MPVSLTPELPNLMDKPPDPPASRPRRTPVPGPLSQTTGGRSAEPKILTLAYKLLNIPPGQIVLRSGRQPLPDGTFEPTVPFCKVQRGALLHLDAAAAILY